MSLHKYFSNGLLSLLYLKILLSLCFSLLFVSPFTYHLLLVFFIYSINLAFKINFNDCYLFEQLHMHAHVIVLLLLLSFVFVYWIYRLTFIGCLHNKFLKIIFLNFKRKSKLVVQVLWIFFLKLLAAFHCLFFSFFCFCFCVFN